jgi:response regulator of citrate/malate metabolism
MEVTSKNNDDTMMASLASDILNYLFSPAGDERLEDILKEIGYE